jgi:hypothetical protein
MSTQFTDRPSTNYDRPVLTSPNPNSLNVTQDVVDYLREYAREKPEIAALWCFGLGFVIGWKLKPW